MKLVIVLLMALALPLQAARPAKKAPTPKPTRQTPSPTPAPTPVVIPKGVEKFTVGDSSESQRTFYLRVPARYSRKTPSRVLFRCPDAATSALDAVLKGGLIADERGWFILAADLVQGQVGPEALFQAIEWAQAKYPVSGEGLMLSGAGPGGQYVQRIASGNPDKVLAVALSTMESFLTPEAWASKIGWLVTGIEGDPKSTPATAEYLAKLRALAIKPVTRSFSEMARPIAGQVDSGEIGTLETEFFAFQDDMARQAAGLPVTTVPGNFVGDLRTLRYHAEGAPEAAGIPDESRVYFGSERLARYWGARIEKVVVATASPLNPMVPFYIRVPANYSPTTRARVLFRCPVYNGIGVRCVSGAGPYQDAADERGWFMVAPTFKQEKTDTKDRSKSYYYPETFSGPATLQALQMIAEKYPIATDGLLLQGFSGGAQFVHRLALWAPDRVAAVAVNSSSWFDVPTPNAARVAWLLTIGESDRAFDNSLTFLEQLRRNNALPIFRSYIGMLHEGSTKVDDFNLLFLKFYDDVTRPRLLGQKVRFNPGPLIPPKAMPWIGDTKDWTFYKNETKAIMRIGEENMVYLPNDEIARFWAGKGIEEDGGKPTGLNGRPY